MVLRDRARLLACYVLANFKIVEATHGPNMNQSVQAVRGVSPRYDLPTQKVISEKPDPRTCRCHWTVNIQTRENSHSALIKWKNQPACFGFAHRLLRLLLRVPRSPSFSPGRQKNRLNRIDGFNLPWKRRSRCLIQETLNASFPIRRLRTSMT